MTIRLAIGAGCILCALAIVAGAFGAHALEQRLAPDRLELWRTAAQYLFYSGVGATLSGVVARGEGEGLRRPHGGMMLVAGGLLFAGTVFALALGAPGWFGAVTPVGGALMIGGFVWMGWKALR